MATVVETGVPRDTARPPFRRIGLSDLRVFPVALSGNVFGWTVDSTGAGSILDAYRQFGGNFLDTADSYSSGRSETMIGNWMRDRRNRDDMVVATKIGKSAENPGLSATAVTRAVHASLERLRTDRIDLLYLHIDDPEVPFEETLFAVDALIRAGKVRYFGCSDHTGDRFIEARVAAGQLGVAPLVALQNRYNLMERRGYETTLAQVAARQGLGVMPRFALASGFLTGKYRTRGDLARHARTTDAGRYLNRKGLRIIAALERISQSVGSTSSAGTVGTTVAAVALAWLLTKPNVVAPVVSTSQPGQVAQLVPAASLRLSRQQLAELDRLSAF